MKWTIQHIEALARKGLKVESFSQKTEFIAPKVKVNAVKVKSEPEGLQYIKQTLQLLKVPFETEHRFHSTRKFRFDVAFPEHKIAIEYEGLVSEKSRHTTIEGYTNDCRKYNLAQIEGWKVLRYTAANYKEFFHDIDSLIK